MSDAIDDFRALKQYRKEQRDKLAVDCPNCGPNRHASRLMPGQTCGWDGYRDPRTRQD